MTRSFYALSLLLLSQGAMATATPPTTMTFLDNDTVPLTLSSLDINRLVVKGDRISSVTCPTGFCTLPMSGGEDGAVAAPTDPQGASLIALDVGVRGPTVRKVTLGLDHTCLVSHSMA